MTSRKSNPAGNVYDKYHTSNPIARWLMDEFLETIGGFYDQVRPKRVLEVGCGEGHLLARLIRRREPKEALGTDVSAEIIDQARAAHDDLSFEVADVSDLPYADDAFDLVIACEVLEHLDRPEAALENIARVAATDVIVSVPREPIWRVLNMMRGRYLTDLGNTPGHVQHFSRRAIVERVDRYLDVVEVATPLPWTAIRGRVR